MSKICHNRLNIFCQNAKIIWRKHSNASWTQIYTTKYEYHKYLVANDLDVDATLNLHWKKKKKKIKHGVC